MELLFELDGKFLLFVQEFIRQDWMNGFWTTVTMLGNGGWFWIVLALGLLIPKKTRLMGLTALIAMGIGALFVNVGLKNIVARTRPYEVIEGLRILVERQSDFSFPSGHSCASFASAFVYFRMAPKKWGIPALILAALIAFSRLYVGVHYPTDVITGILIGILSALAAMALVRAVSNAVRRRRENPASRSSEK